MKLPTKKYVFGSVEVHTIDLADFNHADFYYLLSETEKIRLDTFVLAKRKNEFVAVRYLKELLFPNTEIEYDYLGAPFIKNGPYISISHAVGQVGIAFCNDFKIGFDLEQIREKVHRIKHKFLHEKEYQNCDTEDTETLIKIWSGKEALYKLSGLDELIFATELLVIPINENNWKGSILRNGEKMSVEMRIFTVQDYVISINLSNVQRKN